jgi:hypothetical protein
MIGELPLAGNQTTIANSTGLSTNDGDALPMGQLIGVILAAGFLALFAAISLIPGLRETWYPSVKENNNQGVDRQLDHEEIPMAMVEMAMSPDRHQQFNNTYATRPLYHPVPQAQPVYPMLRTTAT